MRRRRDVDKDKENARINEDKVETTEIKNSGEKESGLGSLRPRPGKHDLQVAKSRCCLEICFTL